MTLGDSAFILLFLVIGFVSIRAFIKSNRRLLLTSVISIAVGVVFLLDYAERTNYWLTFIGVQNSLGDFTLGDPIEDVILEVGLVQKTDDFDSNETSEAGVPVRFDRFIYSDADNVWILLNNDSGLTIETLCYGNRPTFKQKNQLGDFIYLKTRTLERILGKPSIKSINLGGTLGIFNYPDKQLAFVIYEGIVQTACVTKSAVAFDRVIETRTRKFYNTTKKEYSTDQKRHILKKLSEGFFDFEKARRVTPFEIPYWQD